jgi:hypothetical protein
MGWWCGLIAQRRGFGAAATGKKEKIEGAG